MHKFIFIDTNIFEHFPPLKDIDFARLANCTSVTLVIPPITIRELNRHKDTSTRARLRRRAGAALRDLSHWSRTTPPVVIRPSVELTFRAKEPLIDFIAFHLRSDIPDDELLATAIEFAAEQKLGPESVLVTTANLGLLLKGQSQQAIQMLPMPESLRLPDEPDAEEKRIKELEQRLDNLSIGLPRLALTFLDGNTFQEHILRITTDSLDESELAEKCASQKRSSLSCAMLQLRPLAFALVGLAKGRLNTTTVNLQGTLGKRNSFGVIMLRQETGKAKPAPCA